MLSAGQNLYEIYIQTQININNCELDYWKDLPDEEKEVWEITAKQYLK